MTTKSALLSLGGLTTSQSSGEATSWHPSARWSANARARDERPDGELRRGTRFNGGAVSRYPDGAIDSHQDAEIQQPRGEILHGSGGGLSK